MEKLIILAGSPNCGKTETTKLIIEKLKNSGYNDLHGSLKGVSILSKDNIKIAVVTYGDAEDIIDNVIKHCEVQNCDIVVCCSHATRGKKVFDAFHAYIKTLDLSKIRVIPIHKNFLSNLCREYKDNEYTANLVIDLL